ncbi:hypothetical protein ACIF8T_38220 [Streptomyces sp. NPDC085946]|uniref:hypothetical protein n=1 Tax=Streptomyces sp. NPDC085946 TaxID=3365744 RepID=UPI0037D10081
MIVVDHRLIRSHSLTAAQKKAGHLISREYAANEHSFADLKNWRILTKARISACCVTTLVSALTNTKAGRWRTITSLTGRSAPPIPRVSFVICGFWLDLPMALFELHARLLHRGVTPMATTR